MERPWPIRLGTRLGALERRSCVALCRRVRSELGEYSLDDLVLSLQVVLDLESLVKDGFGIRVRVACPLVRRGALDVLDVLTDDDCRQQDELQEGLCNPRDEHSAPGVHGIWQAEESQGCKCTCAPRRHLRQEVDVAPGERLELST